MTDYVHVSLAWPYANGEMHVGHLAGCYLPADIFGRFQRLKGRRVLMVSGSDAHGTPITVTAEQQGITPREVFEKYHHRFLETQQRIGISYDLFTHTDTENHHRIAQDFFLKLLERGHLYQETQELLYDEEAGRFLPDRLVEGTCYLCGYEQARGDQCDNCGHLLDAVQLINPRSKVTGNTPAVRQTEHLFMNLPGFADQLRAYLHDDKDHWRPNVINFARNMVDDLKGRPITRDIEWGIPVPLEGWGDKRLYVWFEAVMGYFTASVEWARNTDQPDAWKEWWYNPEARIYNFIGKDNIPFHTIIWQAELIGVSGIYADDPTQPLTLPYDVPANEYMNVQGAQFSKSRNWAVWLPDILDRYDPDAIRYYVCSVMPETRDSDFRWDEFVERNNNELVAAWGNLANRVLKFAHKHWDGLIPEPGDLRPMDKELLTEIEGGFDSVGDLLEGAKFRAALSEAMRLAREVNGYLDKAPWFGVIKEDKQAAATTVYTALRAIDNLKIIFAPFLPFSSQQLHELLGHEGQLFGDLKIAYFEEQTRGHEALVYDGSKAIGRWETSDLPPGQKLPRPVPLFKKLDMDIVEVEEARLGA